MDAKVLDTLVSERDEAREQVSKLRKLNAVLAADNSVMEYDIRYLDEHLQAMIMREHVLLHRLYVEHDDIPYMHTYH